MDPNGAPERNAVTPMRWPLASLCTLLVGLQLALDAGAAEDFGGGEFDAPVDHITPEQRQAMLEQVQQNIAQLRAQEALPPASALPVPDTLLAWPLRAAPGLTDDGYHGVYNFVDLDNSPDVLDFTCGDRTYNGHQGTDYLTWPFTWNKMDNDEVEVIAAAPGTIVLKMDGDFDRSCSFNNNEWNTVWVQHADERVVYYGHLKNGSLTMKDVGETVVAGEYLGIVGSSGNSTGPHLHLEIITLPLFAWEDPYAGPCNIPTSLWIDQPPYYDSAINKVATHSAPPVFPACPNPETPNLQDVFDPGEVAYFAAYYRDQRSGQQSQYTIYRPNGSVFQTWTHSSPSSHSPMSYWYWVYTLPGGAPTGTWRFEVVYEGQTYEHLFAVGEFQMPALSYGGLAILAGALAVAGLYVERRRRPLP